MSDVAKTALSLLEALVEHLESDDMLSRKAVDLIYDRALARLRGESMPDETPASPVAWPLVLVPMSTPPCETPAALVRLLRWWEANATSGLPPSRLLETVEVERPDPTLIDVEGGDFRFRTVGEELQWRYGALIGRRVSEVLTGRAKIEIVREHRACAGARRPTLMRRSRPASDGSDEYTYWRLLLPFGDRGQTVGLLSAMQFDRYH